MIGTSQYDAVVIGSGPNGLAAAITIAHAGKSVAVFEANEDTGGGVRSAELTLPGFLHDTCSAVYPLAIGSPLFRSLHLARYGLQWVDSPAALAHPFDDGSAVTVERSLDSTAAALGSDAASYKRLFRPLVEEWNELALDVLAPPRWPRHPVILARFGARAIQPASVLAKYYFRHGRARALFAGLAAHSMLPLGKLGSGAFGLVLGGSAHALGWPIVRGGARKLTQSLVGYLTSLGGVVLTNRPIGDLRELPSSRVVLCDVTPRQLLNIARGRLSAAYEKKLRSYRYGMGAFKIDWALSAPVPWAAKECALAATVHLGGELSEIALSESIAWRGGIAEKPFVLVVQPSLFDSSRAPHGSHTLWAYCHVAHNSGFDMTARMESQIERFAPGFRDVILARSVAPPSELQLRNANLVGGDINGGAATLGQLFLRPTSRLYGTGTKGLYLCSAATPPGGGVHGMCGYFAARRALDEMF